jgi:hypothetical protein
MDDAGKKNIVANNTDSERAAMLKQRLERLLREAAQVEVELSRADGSIRGVPHYSVIENRAHELGKQLSRQVQQQQMNELAADHTKPAKCPDCGQRHETLTRSRRLRSIDGQTQVLEPRAYCPGCRRAFFPTA